MEILATLLLVTGFTIGARWIAKTYLTRSESEAEARVRNLLIQESGRGGIETLPPEAKAKRKKKNNGSPTVDRLAGRLERSSLFEKGEGLSFIERIDEELVIAGIRYKMTPYQALSIALLIWSFGVAFPTLMMLTIGLPKVLYGALVLIFALYPIMKLRRMKMNRQDNLKMELPVFIQQLRMLLSSNMTTIDDAIARVVRNAELDPYDSELAREFAQALTEYRMGNVDREVALRGIGKRTQVVSVQNLVEAIIQGLRTGAEMDGVLAEYGKQAREMWRQDMRTFKARKEPLVTIGLVITMGGGFILLSAPLMINLLRTMSGF